MTQTNESPKTSALTRRHFLFALGATGATAAAGHLLWPFDRQTVAPPLGLQESRRTGWALGAEMSIVALHEQRAIAEKAVDAAFAELEAVESVMSLYRPESQLCRLNRDRVLARPHRYLVQVLGKASAVAAASGGDFDVTVQPLWKLYAAATRTGRLPGADDIDLARRQVDWRRVEVSIDRVRLHGSGTAVTLNGIAQGFAADCALEALKANGVQHALVDTGEIGAIGKRQDGKVWTVGIQHPRRQDAFLRGAALDGRCVATSGDYGTPFSRDHVHHHIFDPQTGRSPGTFQSVTVLARTGLEADALSTAVFVAGHKRGIRLVESTPGADAIFVLKNGQTLATDGFPERA